MRERRANPRKLLVASVGVATLNYLGTAATGCSGKVVGAEAQGVNGGRDGAADARPVPVEVGNLMPPPVPTVANLMAPPPMPTVANLMAPPPMPEAGPRDASVPFEVGNFFDSGPRDATPKG